MKPTGFGDFDWESAGYAGGLPDDWVPFPTVEPTTLPRPGYFPTFGPSEFGVLTFPCTFIIKPENTIQVSQGIEAAWMYFFKRLDLFNDRPRQLRLLRNDLVTVLTIDVKPRLLARANTRNRNQRQVDFVAVTPFFEPVSTSTTSGTF